MEPVNMLEQVRFPIEIINTKCYSVGAPATGWQLPNLRPDGRTGEGGDAYDSLRDYHVSDSLRILDHSIAGLSRREKRKAIKNRLSRLHRERLARKS